MNRNNNKKVFLFMLLILFILGLGLGYAFLSQQLIINNTISYDSMKWDVSFTKVVDIDPTGIENDVILGSASISQDKKELSITCDLGKRTYSVDCLTAAQVTNNSTFNVALESIAGGASFADMALLRKYLDSRVIAICNDSNDCKELTEGYVLKAGETKIIAIHFYFKELTEDLLPEEDLSFEQEIDLEWVETEKNNNFREYNFGEEFCFSDECFNVISDNDETVTMLAQHNLDTNYKQNSTNNYIALNNRNGWAYSPGPKEIDLTVYGNGAGVYINQYVSYLQSVTLESSIVGDLISLEQLKGLGCVINNDYSYSIDITCLGTEYINWIANDQNWWTKSASSTSGQNVFAILTDGRIGCYSFTSKYGIRPVITISKEYLEKER